MKGTLTIQDGTRPPVEIEFTDGRFDLTEPLDMHPEVVRWHASSSASIVMVRGPSHVPDFAEPPMRWLDVAPYVISIDWAMFSGWSSVSVWKSPRLARRGGARRRRAVVRKARR